MQRLLGRESVPELPPPTYSNAAVVDRIEREEGVDRDTARAWFGEMLIFLDLCARSDEVLSPPVNVDKAWHAFLLHTRDYEAYCNERFGRLIHHQPTGEPDSRAYRRSWEARQRYSGGMAADPLLWAVPASTAGGGDEDEHDRSDGGHESLGSNDSASDPGGSDSGGGGDSGGGSSCGGSGCGGGGCGGGGS